MPEGCVFTEQEIGVHFICVCACQDDKVVFVVDSQTLFGV